MQIFLSPTREYLTEDCKLHQHGDTHDERGSNETVDTKIQENVEKDDMQEIIDSMTSCEAREILP